MTPQEMASTMLRDVRRWWPVIVLPAIIAASAASLSVGRVDAKYSAVTTMVTVPLVQWDETFLGTSLVRDSGNPSATAATIAEVLDSPRALEITADELGDGWTAAAVDRAVTVEAVPEANLIEVTAEASGPDLARRVSETFAEAVLADRWETISDELDERIGAMKVLVGADPSAGEAMTRLQTLEAIRSEGADPTLRIDGVGKAVEEGGVPGVLVVALALVGGAAIGLLCALAAAQVQRRRAAEGESESDPEDDDPDEAEGEPDGESESDGDDDSSAEE